VKELDLRLQTRTMQGAQTRRSASIGIRSPHAAHRGG